MINDLGGMTGKENVRKEELGDKRGKKKVNKNYGWRISIKWQKKSE